LVSVFRRWSFPFALTVIAALLETLESAFAGMIDVKRKADIPFPSVVRDSITGTQLFHRIQDSYHRQRHSNTARILLFMAALSEIAELNAGNIGESSLG